MLKYFFKIIAMAFSIITCLMIYFCTVSAQSAVSSVSANEPLIFYLNSEEGSKWVTSCTPKAIAGFDPKAGFYKLTNTNHDPNFQHNFKDDAFDVANYPIVRYRFKIIDGAKKGIPGGQFFFATDNGKTIGENGTYAEYPLENTTEWQDVIVDMTKIKDSQWNGTIKVFRIDPIQAPDGTIITVLVDHIGFFPSLEAAIDTDVTETIYKYENQTIIIPAGSIKKGETKDNFRLTSEEIDQDGKAPGSEPVIFYQGVDGKKNIVALSYSNGRTFDFVARESGKYNAGYYHKKYTDTSKHWGDSYITFVSDRMLFGGTSETEFSPDMTMTRGMFVTVLGRMHGIKPEDYQGDTGFSDVNSNEYYTPYIKWTTSMGISTPLTKTTFAPEEPITRVAMAEIIAKYVSVYGYNFHLTPSTKKFADISALTEESKNAITDMQSAGIINGKGDSMFDPNGISTRAEVATVMSRTIKAILDLPLTFKSASEALTSIVLNCADPENAKKLSVVGDGKISDNTDGVTITGFNHQFYITYTPTEDMYLEDYPYVKMCYKVNSSPSMLAQFYYYTDKTVTAETPYPYLQFTLKGNIGEWNTMSFDFSTIEKINAMSASSGSEWSGKLDNFSIYPLRMFSNAAPTTRNMTIKYLAFFSTKEEMDAFTEEKLTHSGSSGVQEEDLVVSEKLGKDRIHIGAFFPFYGAGVDEDNIKELAEAGIDISFVSTSNTSLYAKQNILNWHAKYGIMAWMDDKSLVSGAHVSYSSAMKSTIEKSYASHPAFYGNIFSDEPGIVHYESIGKYVDEYHADFPGKLPFVNLLPLYASNDQLTYGASAQKIDFYDTPAANFEDYVRRYVEKVDTPYISTDIYPLRWNVVEKKKETYKDYIKSIEIISKVCRETNREFWCYIQSFASKGRPYFRSPDEADLRWQAYSMLSFGIKTMFYYVWHGPSNSDYFNTPIDGKGEKNALWYGAKNLNNELIAISDTYLQYKNIGAFTHNATAKTPYLQMIEPLKEFAPISEIKCDDPLLIGCFNKIDGSANAFTVVNMSEMYLNKTITVSLKINGTKVTAYLKGIPTLLTPSNGYYTFDLICGDGVFVTVE